MMLTKLGETLPRASAKTLELPQTNQNIQSRKSQKQMYFRKELPIDNSGIIMLVG
jgi:hypothetical protein